MNAKSVHEPEAALMSAEDAWDDAQRMTRLLQENAAQTEPLVHLDVPFSYFLSVLDTLNRNDRVLLHERIEERLAI